MTTTTSNANRYLAALERLAGAVGEAQALADVLDHFAGLLRGSWPDPDGPPLELFPSASQIRRVLERRVEALGQAGDEWRRLPDEAREHLAPPDELG